MVGWHTPTNKRTHLVLTPLRIALWHRDRHGHAVTPGQRVHHQDAGSQVASRQQLRLAINT